MILPHNNIPASRGYYSKVTDSRRIITSEIGATAFTLYEQIIPPGGYIVSHYHAYEESLTFLSGSVSITIEGETSEIEADVTIFIPPHTKHSVQNHGDIPARLIAVHATTEPKVHYPDRVPAPVKW